MSIVNFRNIYQTTIRTNKKNENKSVLADQISSPRNHETDKNWNPTS